MTAELLSLQQRSANQEKKIRQLTKELGEYEAMSVGLCCTMVHFVDGKLVEDARATFGKALRGAESSPTESSIEELRSAFRDLLSCVSKELARRLSLKSKHAFTDRVRVLASDAYILKSVTKAEA